MNTLELRINREKRGKSVNWVQQLLVDGVVLTTDYTLDYHELARSTVESGGYWPFTCGCGEPGCAGLTSPVEVQHTGSTVSWHITDPEPERHFIFHADQYHHAIASSLTQVSKLVMQRQRDLPIGPYRFNRVRLNSCLAICAHELSSGNTKPSDSWCNLSGSRAENKTS